MNRTSFLTRICFFVAACLLFVSTAAHAVLAADSSQQAPPRPNIVYILCDDLGYGDVHCLNPRRGKIPTPNIDRLATQGMAFTDAHGGSSVCTPTRYGILTGRYAWRSRLQSGVLAGESPPLIAPQRLTVPVLLKQHGYATACLGKWHLGLKFGPHGYADSIEDGPLEHGFDYFYGISASLDMPPFAFVENHRFTEIPSVTKKWLRAGPAAKSFDAVDVLPTLTRKAVAYIGGHAASAKLGNPFFLYLAFTSPHTPIVPTAEWQGKSPLGPYGDFVMQTDWATGEVLHAIDKAGLADDTLVIFTSDNGCSPAAGVDKLEAKGHYPSAEFRGYKSDIWDGGHRIPFIVRWPGQVKAAAASDQLTCLTDLLATCADLVGDKLPDNAGEDSVSILPALLGRDKAPLREAVVHHSIDGLFAIRQGPWKLEFCPGSGGWSTPHDAQATKAGLPEIQLYNMRGDVGERTNVEADHRDIVRRLTKLFERYVAEGRSTPGATQSNDVRVEIFKTASAKASEKLREIGD
ncbi:MAG TPA: arylsulfatase [Pirellulales bacterium]|nr:arylsulfatase [Pirellulales bacterium]